MNCVLVLPVNLVFVNFGAVDLILSSVLAFVKLHCCSYTFSKVTQSILVSFLVELCSYILEYQN